MYIFSVIWYKFNIYSWNQIFSCEAAQLAIVKLTTYTRDIIVGLLLSDAWLIFGNPRSKNALLGFQQSVGHGGYFWFVFCSLSHYCSSYPALKKGTRLGKENFSLEFKTRSLPCLLNFILSFILRKSKEFLIIYTSC